MSLLKTTDPLVLRLLFSDELYLVDEPSTENVILGKAEQAVEKVEHAAEKVEQPAEKVEQPPETLVFDYLGENNKYFLLLVNQPGRAILNAKDLESLISILHAKKMEVRDVAILNLAKYPGVSFHLLKSYFVNTRLVLFGIDPQSLQLPAIESNKITVHEGVKVLCTYSFHEMSENPSTKRVFWNEMKLL